MNYDLISCSVKRMIDVDEFKELFDPDTTKYLSVENIRKLIDIYADMNAVPVMHGQWNIILDDYDCEMMQCSCCKTEFYDGDNDTVDSLYNYCPNCGAKMDGGK